MIFPHPLLVPAGTPACWSHAGGLLFPQTVYLCNSLHTFRGPDRPTVAQV